MAESREASGELDWDFPASEPPLPAQPTSATSPTSPPNASSRQTIRRDDAEMAAVIDEEREKTPPPSLAIANAMESATMPPPAGGFDHPDAAVDIEIGGEVEIEIDEVVPAAGPALPSLTERQGVPRILLGPQEISKLPIDHRAGFLLGAMDGMQTMEEILDVCPLPPNEALELIRALVQMGVIAIE